MDALLGVKPTQTQHDVRLRTRESECNFCEPGYLILLELRVVLLMPAVCAGIIW